MPKLTKNKLIIISLIALIVIAAINPIEQANRARDTGQKADSSQLISAIDRYFAARIQYPWVAQGVTVDNDAELIYMPVANYAIGICAENPADSGTTDCVGSDGDGELITTSELKTEFRNRRFIDAYVANPTSQIEQDFIMMGKALNSDSVYACYVPMANSNRTRACADGIVYTLAIGSGVRTPVPVDCDPEVLNWITSGNLAASSFVCVPE